MLLLGGWGYVITGGLGVCYYWGVGGMLLLGCVYGSAQPCKNAGRATVCTIHSTEYVRWTWVYMSISYY